MPNGYAEGGKGKFVRLKCGAPPIAVSKFDTCARCPISSIAVEFRWRRQPRTISA